MTYKSIFGFHKDKMFVLYATCISKYCTNVFTYTVYFFQPFFNVDKKLSETPVQTESAFLKLKQMFRCVWLSVDSQNCLSSTGYIDLKTH